MVLIVLVELCSFAGQQWNFFNLIFLIIDCIWCWKSKTEWEPILLVRMSMQCIYLIDIPLQSRSPRFSRIYSTPWLVRKFMVQLTLWSSIIKNINHWLHCSVWFNLCGADCPHMLAWTVFPKFFIKTLTVLVEVCAIFFQSKRWQIIIVDG